MENLEKLSDAELVHVMKNGQKEKVCLELYQRYCDFVYKHCLKWSENKQDAEDLTQETFANAFSALDNFKNKDAKFSTWLYRISYNNFVNFYKKNNQIFLELSEKNSFKNLDDEINKSELKIVLKKEIDNLNPLSKEALEMFYFQELKYREIAKKLNQKIGTIKSRLFHARRNIKEILTSKYPEFCR